MSFFCTECSILRNGPRSKDGVCAKFIERQGQSPKTAEAEGSAGFTGCITLETEDELRVLVELLCHSTGAPGFDARIARLREEAKKLWSTR